MFWHYYNRELWRKRAVMAVYVAIPTVLFLFAGMAESLEGALIAIVLFMPLLSRHFRNLLWSLVIKAVYCRTCGREIPAVVFSQCEQCGFQSMRNLFSPCPNCQNYVHLLQCPTCKSNLLISREER